LCSTPAGLSFGIGDGKVWIDTTLVLAEPVEGFCCSEDPGSSGKLKMCMKISFIIQCKQLKEKEKKTPYLFNVPVDDFNCSKDIPIRFILLPRELFMY